MNREMDVELIHTITSQILALFCATVEKILFNSFVFFSYSSLAIAYASCYVDREFHYTPIRQEEERRLNSICHHKQIHRNLARRRE